MNTRSGSYPKVPRQRSVEQVFPNASSLNEEQSYEKFVAQGKGPSTFKNKEKEDQSLYEQLRQQQRDRDDDSDWDETTGSIRAPVVLEDEDIEFLEQLKKKKDENFRSLDEQVEKFKERRHNLVLVAPEEHSLKPPDMDIGVTKSSTSAEKRKLRRLPSYLKTKEKRTKVEATDSCIIPSLIPYVDNESEEEEEEES